MEDPSSTRDLANKEIHRKGAKVPKSHAWSFESRLDMALQILRTEESCESL